LKELFTFFAVDARVVVGVLNISLRVYADEKRLRTEVRTERRASRISKAKSSAALGDDIEPLRARDCGCSVAEFSVRAATATGDGAAIA
jgi:hypothetical protein